MNSETTYLMREVEITFSTVCDQEVHRELTLAYKLSDSAAWTDLETAINKAAAAFQGVLLNDAPDTNKPPGDEPMIQAQMEYTEMPDDGVESVSVAITDTETIETAVMETMVNLLTRMMPRFHRKVTLITFLEGGAK